MNKIYYLILILLFFSEFCFTQNSIFEIQYTENPGNGTYPSPLENQTVTVGGIVTANNYNSVNYFISSSNGGIWQGIFIYNDYNPEIGDSIIIQGEVFEYYGLTEIKNLTNFEIISNSNPLPIPETISTHTANTQEAYEGVFIEVTDVSVTQTFDESGEFLIDDGSGPFIISDGIFTLMEINFPLISGYEFSSIKGVVTYSWGEFKLCPRSIDDFQSEQEAFVLSLNDTIISETNGFEYPVWLSYLGQTSAVCYEFTLEYDSTIIEYSGFTKDGSLSSNGTIDDLSVPGQVHLIFAGDFSFSGVGKMITLNFHPLHSGISDISFSSGSLNGNDISYYVDNQIEIDINDEPIGDTLTVIQRPLLNIPEIIIPGQEFEIMCCAPFATTDWQAYLIHKNKTVQLTINQAMYNSDQERWYLVVLAPQPVFYELYDLKITASGNIEDVSKNAVHLIPQEKDSYYFVHITDTHLPTHFYYEDPQSEGDTSEVIDFREVIKDINLIHPEFVLLTGDFINEGELEDFENRRYYSIAQRLLAEFEIPVYLVSGNHDIGGWDATPVPQGSARHNWWRFFGWKWLQSPPDSEPYYTQNYSFDYGSTHYTGMEAYINYDGYMSEIYGEKSFIDSQLAWLENDLLSAPENSSKVLFYHKDFDYQINLSELEVDMALYGHIHSNSGDIYAHPYNLATDNICDGARAYRLIRVDDGILQPYNTSYAGSSGENLAVEFFPSNIGILDSITAQITNNHSIEFNHAQIKFIMPKGNYGYFVENGILDQIDKSGIDAVCYVNAIIPANGSISVSIKVDLTLDMAVDIKVLLEGPFNGIDMNTSLTNSTNFPINQPYNTAPWNYNGTESVDSIPNPDIVDWILVEFRDAPDAASATEATIVERQAAFLKNDGSVVGLDGTSILTFNHSIFHSLFVVVRHRNHIDIISANPLTESEGIYTYDFTTSIDQAYVGSAGYKSIFPGVYGMAGGDIDANGTINFSDILQWSFYGGTKGYLSEDLNFDGEVNNPDKDNIWILNTNNVSSQVPE